MSLEMIRSDLIEVAASRAGLPLGLVDAIVKTESAGYPFAIRFEPAFLERYVPAQPERFGACSLGTERLARATSWGVMQVMGQVARKYGCREPFLSALCAPEAGLYWGCQHLVRLRDRWLEAHGWDGVIASYNAGSPRRDRPGGIWVNQSYVDRVRALWGAT